MVSRVMDVFYSSYLDDQQLLMFRQGKPRAFIHNLRLAAMLSFVAGMVNICGVLSIHLLTTNVTGHFAFFAEEFISEEYKIAFRFIIYILSFLAGAFVCGLLIELMLRRRPGISHTLPMLLEVLILFFVGVSSLTLSNESIGCILLFSMGLQNALVTKVSRATVRTTHLTGLFTDLGIELSQLFFYKNPVDTARLFRSLYLRFAIILFFFFGGISGGFLYHRFQLQTLILAAISVLVALLYDNLRILFLLYRRKLHS